MEREQKREIILNAVMEIKKDDLKAGEACKDMPASIFTFKTLKPQIAENAIKSYAHDLNPEDIVVLCDLSLIGKGKKGLIFSTEGFYSSEMNTFNKKNPLPMPVRYKELVEVVSQNRSDIIFKFKDGPQKEIYGGIYTEFITLALNRILKGLQETNGLQEVEDAQEAEGFQKMEDESKTEAICLEDGVYSLEVLFKENGEYTFIELDTGEWFSIPEMEVEKAAGKLSETEPLVAEIKNSRLISLKKAAVEKAPAKKEEHTTPEELLQMGLRYMLDGSSKNQEDGFQYIMKAAETGHIQAQYVCGKCYAVGLGVEKNEEKATYWFEKAAERGQLEAQEQCAAKYYVKKVC